MTLTVDMEPNLLGSDEAYPIRAGFTGTQKGMTDEQKRTVRELLVSGIATHLHLGDCIGADAEAHAIGYNLNLFLVGHPPDDPKKRAFLKYDEEREPRPYLVRNHYIVREARFVIATPDGRKEKPRGSGTWATIRYARNMRMLYIVWPDGTYSIEP